ncbi:sensor histidine kinase [Streptomyces kanamyceticus]|uniref:histidine kinase n=1 Tax=Streptomyces kanamyceticus TaxID=1967 RepID=A0A5J6GNH4_STRKN|nr:HAMP domain-containing sensor histidine kinase [Streptomyces kanamyceticus]QEU96817.1 sensor histidine kinase [Streptomyces kanamyceticus]
MRLPRRGRPRALSIHLRLFLGFGGALVACSALMVAVIYVGIRFVPTYDLTTPIEVPSPLPSSSSGEPQWIEPHTVSPSGTPEPGQKIPASGVVRDKEDVWASVLAISIGGLLVVTAVGLAAGWVLSRRLLAPLHTINRAAAQAGEGDLAYRINAQGPRDELKQLADTFDTTLERLEESFAAHQRFAANASHELLTPLATTRAALQLAAADDSGESLRELLPMLTETNERNIRVVKELLALAAADQVPCDAEPVDFAALVREVVADATAPAEGAALAVHADVAPCEVLGSATLLRQLVTNLVENAVTHNTGAPDGFVDVTVRDEGAEGVVLEVGNSGPRIAPEITDRLFEPFYRARPRVGSERGHGLGLALVRSVARAHGGTASATARTGGGLVVRVVLPGPSA